MTALLALTSALVIGVVDFLGGHTARRAPALSVALWAQALGVPLALIVALVADSERVRITDIAWAVAAGACGSIGLTLFYLAMSRGLVSIVAPLAGVIGAAIPAAFGILRGDDLGLLALVGLAIAIVSIFVVSMAPGGPKHVDARTVLLLAVGAGALFGGFFVFYSLPSEDAGLWPVLVLRLAGTGTLLAVALGLRRPLRVDRPVLARTGVMGALEVSAGVALLLALQKGPVSVASVLSSMYPVATVILAAIVLSERLSRLQLAGVALALGAILLISS